MKLVASVIVRNELNRYLRPFIQHLAPNVDEIRVLDDGSSDGTYGWLLAREIASNVALLTASTSFMEHEGRARQELLDWTLDARPTHVLSIDADEFVDDWPKVHAALERGRPVVTLEMQEVWEADGDCLCLRMDGGWRPHPISAVWKVPSPPDLFSMQQRELACGREPEQVRRLPSEASGAALLHFGWSDPAEREARARRYLERDRGRFHAKAHLDSILWPPERVQLWGRPWPADLRRLLGVGSAA